MQTFTPPLRNPSYRLAGAQRPQQKQQGYTIVELSIAVAIAGVLLVSAIGLVNVVVNTSRANDTATLLTRTVAKIEKSWSSQPTYAGLDLGAVVATGAFEGLSITRNAAAPFAVTGVNSKFDRPITVNAPAGIPGPALSRGYVITMAGVPTNVCSDMVAAAYAGGARGIVISPEITVGAATAATNGPTVMALDTGVLTAPAATATVEAGAVVLDGAQTTPAMATALGVSGCGTRRPTVALSFVGWK